MTDQENIGYKQITDLCMQDKIGVHGLSVGELGEHIIALKSGFEKLKNRKFLGANPILELTSKTDDLEAIEHLAEAIRKRFNHVVVVGSGGSALGGSALLQFAPCSSPSFDFLDNIDPDMLESITNRVDLVSTCFIIISKSGTTVESLSQLYILTDLVKKKVGRTTISASFIVITEPEDVEGANPMREIARDYNMRVLDFDKNIGGRFSILTNVGLLPAAIAGIDIRALRRGAQKVVMEMDSTQNASDFAPAIGAAVQFGFYQRGRNLSVMLPYSWRLAGFSAWYRQCWAESLGKDGKGSTPIRAVGSTDQHSQLQLYLNGPKDKLFTMITLKREGTGGAIEFSDPRPELAYMRGKTLGDVMAAQQRATFATLANHHCPVRLIELEKLDEEMLGRLLMNFTLEIIFMAFLQEVNPFDQPAVEESKVLAREYLLDSGDRL